jgi:hypothetical protein
MQRISVVLPMPFGPMMATRSPASTLKLMSRSTSTSVPGYRNDSFSMLTTPRCSFFAWSKRMNGFCRDEGLISSILIFSSSRLREVAWRAFDAFAEKRRTNSCRSEMRSFALAFEASTRARACTDASMKSS